MKKLILPLILVLLAAGTVSAQIRVLVGDFGIGDVIIKTPTTEVYFRGTPGDNLSLQIINGIGAYHFLTKNTINIYVFWIEGIKYEAKPRPENTLRLWVWR